MPLKSPDKSYRVEGVAQTPAVMLFRVAEAPQSVTLEGQPVAHVDFSNKDGLLWIHFENEARPRTLTLKF